MLIGSLVYRDLVIKNFNFLVSDYGYALLPSSATSYVVSYASGSVTVEAMYDASHSFELDIRLSNTEAGSTIESFSLHEIVHAGGSSRFRTPQVADERPVANALENCAMVLKEYGDNFLRGDFFSFRRLSKYREQRSTEHEISTTVKMVKAKADLAWQKKNYMDVFSLLDSIRKHLSDADLKKLEYCEKKPGIK